MGNVCGVRVSFSPRFARFSCLAAMLVRADVYGGVIGQMDGQVEMLVTAAREALDAHDATSSVEAIRALMMGCSPWGCEESDMTE